MQVGNEVTSFSSREVNHASNYDRDDSWMSYYRPLIMDFSARINPYEYPS